MDSGKCQDAMRIYRRLIALNPDSTESWFKKGLVHIELKEHRKAIYCYQKVLKQDPQNAGAWNNSAICYWNLDYKKAAIRRYQTAIQFEVQQKTEDSYALSNLISCYGKLEQFGNALITLDFWLKHFPDSKYAKQEREALMNEKQISNLTRLNTIHASEDRLTKDQISILIHRIFLKLGRPLLRPR